MSRDSVKAVIGWIDLKKKSSFENFKGNNGFLWRFSVWYSQCHFVETASEVGYLSTVHNAVFFATAALLQLKRWFIWIIIIKIIMPFYSTASNTLECQSMVFQVQTTKTVSCRYQSVGWKKSYRKEKRYDASSNADCHVIINLWSYLWMVSVILLTRKGMNCI